MHIRWQLSPLTAHPHVSRAAEALHFEEAEDIEAEAAGLKPIDAAATGAADAAPTAPLSPSKDEAAIRKRMVDVMIAAAKERHAARLAAARKRAAEAKGAGECLVGAVVGWAGLWRLAWRVG